MVTFDLPDPDLERVGHGGDGAMTVTVNRGRVVRVEVDRRALREGLIEVAPSFMEAANAALAAEKDAYLKGTGLESRTMPDRDAYMGPAMLVYEQMMSQKRKLDTTFRDVALDAVDLMDYNHELLAYHFDPIARQGVPFTRALPALRSVPKPLIPRTWEPGPSPFTDAGCAAPAPGERDDKGVWEAIAAHRRAGRGG